MRHVALFFLIVGICRCTKSYIFHINIIRCLSSASFVTCISAWCSTKFHFGPYSYAIYTCQFLSVLKYSMNINSERSSVLIFGNRIHRLTVTWKEISSQCLQI